MSKPRFWEMQVFERPNGRKELGWRWPDKDWLAGLSQPYDYDGNRHQQSRKVT